MKNKIKKILKTYNFNEIHNIFYYKRKQSFLFDLISKNEDYFLKIRKRPFHNHKDFNKAIKDNVLVNTSKKEWESLNYFYNLSKDNPFISFVKPVTYIEEINGIVTEKVEGKDLWKLIRKNQPHDLFENIGKGLRQTHEEISIGEKEIEFNFKEITNPKIDRKINKLKQKFSNKKSAIIEGLPIVDIRDIFISDKNEIYFLDTPPLNKDFVYRNIAYLIGTLRIINQGYLNFIFKRVDKKYENNFLEGYFNNDEYDKDLLNLFILERLTVFYNNALNTLSNNKRFKIPFVKKLVKNIYIDKFYYREMNEIIKEIEEEK